jgi:very-short-patch-repair endonuclease
VRRQHGVITRRQLLDAGLTAKGVEHRVRTGRLRRVHRGVYVVGRPELTQNGRWMAAVLACGPGAALSHDTAAQLWGIRRVRPGPIHVSIPAGRRAKVPGIVIHRRTTVDATARHNITLTRPAATLTDLATELSTDDLEAAVNEADKLDLIDPERLRSAIGRGSGARRLKALLDHHTYTESALERRFLRLARKAGLPPPNTQHRTDGFRTDFFWDDLNLVVETDGLRYHRTPAQQTKDHLRDQEHTAAGRTPLRFTHAQVHFDPDHVTRILLRVAERAR